MTLHGTNSNCSRYDIDERLTIDPPATPKGPLQLGSTQTEGTRRGTTTPTAQATANPKATRPSQRSLFSAYWKTNPRPSRSSTALISSEVDTLQSPPPRRVLYNHNKNNKTYSYNYYDRDPYQFFGIEKDVVESKTSTTEDEEDDSSDNDSESMNSYERVLQTNEGVTETNRPRSSTCPTLSRARVGIETMDWSNQREATTQSDTALFAETSPCLRRLSCLRKSRFAFDDKVGSLQSGKLSENNPRTSSSVSFEATIQVHVFRPPVEKWAPTGWSNWFGGWH